MDSTQKFAWIESQIRRVTLGHLNEVSCPYCESSTVIGEDELCCAPMGEVTAALLSRLEAAELIAKNGFTLYPSEAQFVAGAGSQEKPVQ